MNRLKDFITLYFKITVQNKIKMRDDDPVYSSSTFLYRHNIDLTFNHKLLSVTQKYLYNK